MKTLNKGMSSSTIFLSALIFVQCVFPYYLFARIETNVNTNVRVHSIEHSSYNVNSFDSEVDRFEDPLNSQIEMYSPLDLERLEHTNLKSMIPGGPDQPEVQSFTPMGTDGMVDPFSGDFSYNIPLMDIDGYPINIGYNAGVGMDQEATWVGLGWNLNPGVINRVMRGVPDDFNGIDQLVEERKQKTNKTIGTSVGVDVEVFAFKLKKPSGAADTIGKISLSASLGVSYNNFSGYNADLSFGPSFSIGKDVGASLGLQFSSSTQGGASIGGNVGLSVKDDDAKAKLTIGSSVNSRQGLQQYSINFSVSKNTENSNRRRDVAANQLLGRGMGSTYNVGQSTYVPQLKFSTGNHSFTARFKIGPDATGTDPSTTFTGYFYESHLKDKIISRPVYGYFHLEKGQSIESGQLDFNRENDGVFTVNTPALPLTYLTYDVFSVSGHGVSGSYRMDRNDIGHTFDNKVENNSSSSSVGGEVNLGGTAKGGVDVGVTITSGHSSVWKKGNDALPVFKFNSSRNRFRDASDLSYDRSDEEFNNIGGSEPVYFRLTGTKSVSSSISSDDGFNKNLSTISKSSYYQSNQVLMPYTIKELKAKAGYGGQRELQHINSIVGIDHHIGAFTVTKTDGMRYYYGLPAVSKRQENVSFAVGKTYDYSVVNTPDANTGLVAYSAADASLNNTKGIDNYYNRQITPKYIHSYLLTSVLSPNYIDTDDIPGPSSGDIGDYILFEYNKIDDYKWRNPITRFKANYDAGLNTDVTDDKANYIYGEKELYYVDKITTKNYVAIFKKSARHDGASVIDQHGGLDTMNSLGSSHFMQRLDEIILYNKADYDRNANTAVPIKTVHFKYDYSLCSKYPGNVYYVHQNLDSGKLTLKEIFFTYGNSKKGSLNKYRFEYGYNPNYNSKNVDRWGTFKENPSGITNDIVASPLRNSDFPYVGSNKQTADLYASAWNLSSIDTPTGGRIKVVYESDDYAFVQHKRATQMFLISGVEDQDPESNGSISISDPNNKNRAIKFDMLPNTQISDYVKVGDVIYFRAALSMDKDRTKFDYVPGYAEVMEVDQDGNKGIIRLKPGVFRDSGNDLYNPIAVAGVQFARNYLSRLIPPTSSSGTLPELNEIETMKAMAAAFVNLRELFTGPNWPLWKADIGSNLLVNKSWIRLQNPNYKKLGGGHRVKEIRMYDNWDNMAVGGVESYYGQEYIYEDQLVSTGVAAYEPQIGGEENVWRTYVANDISLTWAPDSRNYQETPFGEQLFPNAMVGYSKVIVRSVSHQGVYKTATGRTINEFYTTRDFPTIVSKSKAKSSHTKSNVNMLLFTKTLDLLAMSQGFVVENNDMNGKPKSTQVYGEGQDALLSSVEYKYKSVPEVIENISANRLLSDATVIESNGDISKVIIGRSYEAVADFRETVTKVNGGGVAINLNFTVPFILVGMILGSNVSSSNTEFRSASLTKSIERKGLLQQTIAKDNKSIIVTDNLAYDANTGEVLLTSVNNAYGDTIYNFTYPAHWIYDGMGQAYRNLGFESKSLHTFNNGYTSTLTNAHLVEGDEVIYSYNNGPFYRGWITEVSSQGVRMLNQNNEPASGVLDYLKVMRSGRRNLQSTPIGTITLSKNPLHSLQGNVFDEVIAAEAIQYDTDWKQFCNCNLADVTFKNPYKLGLKGNWFPTATYVHLSNRTQDFENQNTNIRKDGVFESFNPMFKLENGKWTFDKRNWTFTSQVTEFAPNGQPLETKDALNRYSSSQLGYNQTHQVAMAVNAQKRQIGATNFEDLIYNHCPDRYINWKKGGVDLSTNDLQEGMSHTGRYSLKVSAGSSVMFSDTISATCETATLCDFSHYILDRENQRIIEIPFAAGVTVTYEIISGTPIPNLEESSNGMKLSFSSTNSYQVIVQLLDENGCFENVVIQE